MGNNMDKLYNANRYWFNMSARKIPKNYRNVTGIAAHRKSLDIASFESTLERDFLYLIEFSPDVESFEVQPVTIEWKNSDGRTRRYTPDVLVHFTSKSRRPPTLFEVKYRDDLSKNWKELKPRFKQAISYAKRHGWRFKIASEVEIRTTLLETARFLLPFTRQGPGPEAYMELLDGKLKKLHKTTPRELLQAAFKDEWNQAKLLPTLWYLVGTFQIGCELSEPLTMKTPIWYLP
jgi:hypothetical protein